MKTLKKTASVIMRFRISLLLVFMILILDSCQKFDQGVIEPQSAVNIVNATIDMPSIAFSLNKIHVQGKPLSYTNETGYFITFSGTRDFDVTADGLPDYILERSFDFKQNTYHTIFITGESKAITTLFTEDDLTNPPKGKAKLRFVHLSPDGGSLVLALKDGTALFPEQSFKTASPFIAIDPGVYDLELKTATGTVLSETNVTIAEGNICTAWSKGMRSGIYNLPIGLQFRAIN